MRTKPRREVYSIYLLTSLILFTACSATDNENKAYDSKPYDTTWLKGKRLFLDECGYCHVEKRLDEEFELFINRAKGQKESNILLKNIFVDTNHQRLNYNFIDEEIDALSKFILTPPKSGFVK